MKILIAGDRKALRKGEYVEAAADSQEFIYDTDTVEDDSEVTVNVLKSIAEKNGITVKASATRGDLISKLNIELPKLEIPEQNKKTQSAIIKEVVAEAGEAREPGDDADEFEVEVFTECIQRLNAEGVVFKIKQLGNLVKKEIAEQGLVISTAQRKEMVNEILGDFEPEDWDEVEKAIEHICKEVPDTDRAQALSAIRRLCKANEVEMPKREKAAKGGKGSFRQRAIAFMIENSPVDSESLMEFVTQQNHKTPEKAVARLQNMQTIIDAAYAAGVASVSGEAEAE